MDFQLDPDQVDLGVGFRQLLAERFPLAAIRSMEGLDRVVDELRWQSLVNAGVFMMLLSEQDGGVGWGRVELVVVFEELGRALVPGPVAGTLVATTLDPTRADGFRRTGLLDGRGAPERLILEHPGDVDDVLLLIDGAVGLLDAADLNLTTEVRGLDPLTPVAIVDRLPKTTALAADSDSVFADLMLMNAASQIGRGAICVDLAVDYARERQQFGRPIGSFQAVKHLCADMLVRVEVARSAVLAAAGLVDQPDVVAAEAKTLGCRQQAVLERALAGAKLLADEAAIANARTAIQVYGGMGFTWEVPLHLYLKRARVAATAFGTAATLTQMLSAAI